MPATHTVTNQVPPLLDIDVAAADPALHAGLAAAGTAWDGTLTGLGLAAGSAELQEAARLANENGPRLRTHDAGRQPDRRGRLSPRLPHADAARRRIRPARRAVGPGGRRACTRPARRGVLRLEPHRLRAPLPGLDDVRSHPCAAPRAGGRGPLRARIAFSRLRFRATTGVNQTRPTGRDVDDREAGRLRRPGQHHQGGARRSARPARRAAIGSPGTSGSPPRR